jgi:hypothetical protein
MNDANNYFKLIKNLPMELFKTQNKLFSANTERRTKIMDSSDTNKKSGYFGQK